MRKIVIHNHLPRTIDTTYRVVMMPKAGVNGNAKVVTVRASSVAEAFDKADKKDDLYEAIRLDYARDTIPMNSTGKYASEWSRIMSDLRDRKPRPINKLWNNPAIAPPEQVAAAEQKIREWNKEYNFASRMQKKALEEDNENFRRQQAQR